MGSKSERVIIRHGTQDYGTRVTDNPDEYVEAHRDVHSDDNFHAFVAPPLKSRGSLVLYGAATAVFVLFFSRLLLMWWSAT